MNNEVENLFLDELASIYDAEQQLLKALPRMARVAEFEELREALEAHEKETQRHVQRLLKVFEILGVRPRTRPCGTVEELILETEEIVQEYRGSGVLDAGLVAASQKLEHYEIASYGTLCTWARILGHDPEIVTLLRETLIEEKETDDNLWEVTRSLVSSEAAVPVPAPAPALSEAVA